jgi:hypothetical protein
MMLVGGIQDGTRDRDVPRDGHLGRGRGLPRALLDGTRPVGGGLDTVTNGTRCLGGGRCLFGGSVGDAVGCLHFVLVQK